MFTDRRDAGRKLAQRLEHLRGADPPPVVLGLPRGGVVVAAEIANHLIAPLDVLVVRKLGAPARPELALGAVTDSDHPRHVLNLDVIAAVGAPASYLEKEIDEQLAEVRRRQSEYRRGRSGIEYTGRTVIVADDGVATGATMRAALAALRAATPARLILAIPVAPSDTAEILKRDVDEFICLASPPDFTAVGQFYSDFAQTTDEEVIALLESNSKVSPRSAN